MPRKAKDYSKPRPIRGVLATAFGVLCGHSFRIAMINRDGAEAVHETEFILTVAVAIIGSTIVAWMAINNKRPALLTIPLFMIAAGISAFVWH